MSGNGLQAVVPCEPTAGLDPQATHREVQLVVHDDDTGRVAYAVATNQLPDGLARLIHEGLREGDGHPLTTDANLTRQGQLLGTTQQATMAFGQHCNGVGTHVVPRAVVVASGVPEADDQ
jgi:hypothetical protein